MTIDPRFVVAFTLALASPVAAAETETGRPVTVLIDQGPRGVVYTVDSVQVPRERLMEVIHELMVSPDDRHRKVAVLLHEEAPFGRLLDVRGFLHHVGFQNLKYYYYGSDKRMMAEIALATPAVPFAASDAATSKR